MEWIKCAACNTPYQREAENGNTVLSVYKACSCRCKKVVECQRPDEYKIYVPVTEEESE